MALKPCKSCKHQVDTKAKVCPSCGVSDPGVTAGQKILGFIFLIVIIFVAVKVCSGSGDETVSVKKSEPAAEKVVVKTLGITPRQYAERINLIIAQMKKPYQVDGSAVESGEVNDVLTASLGPYASLVAGVSKHTGEILDITLIGAGDGKPVSGLEIMLMATAALTAAVPDADYKEVISKLPAMTKGTPEIYGNVKLSVKQTDQLGIWFFASPL